MITPSFRQRCVIVRVIPGGVAELGGQELAVEARDGVEGDALGALRLAFRLVRAVAEPLGVHGAHHGAGAPAPLRLPLRQPPRWVSLALVNSIADAFLQAATHAPQPMQAAASRDASASTLATGTALASGALPVLTEM